MTPTKTEKAPIVVANQTFAHGEDVFIEGKSRVRADHPAVSDCPGFFDSLEEEVTIGHVEAATAEPGEKRGRQR